MFRSSSAFPSSVPVLSRGKHRSARKGACFMEFASYLAGESWSDHPRCTHPLLAELARQVNDHTTDDQRSRLVDLVPSVIGVTTDDVRVDVLIGLRCARAALPIVSSERQNVMALSILTADRVLEALDGPAARGSEQQSRTVLDQVPHAARWARQFSAAQTAPSPEQYRRRCAPYVVQSAVRGIAQACVGEPDAVLRDLLVDAIAICTTVRDRKLETARPNAQVSARR